MPPKKSSAAKVKKWINSKENANDIAATFFIITELKPSKLLCDYRKSESFYGEASRLYFDSETVTDIHRELLHDCWMQNKNRVRVSNF